MKIGASKLSNYYCSDFSKELSHNRDEQATDELARCYTLLFNLLFHFIKFHKPAEWSVTPM